MGAQLEALRGESPRIVAIRAQVAQLLARQTGARRLPPIAGTAAQDAGTPIAIRICKVADSRSDALAKRVRQGVRPITQLQRSVSRLVLRLRSSAARHAFPHTVFRPRRLASLKDQCNGDSSTGHKVDPRRRERL